jgi:hypothetical protein
MPFSPRRLIGVAIAAVVLAGAAAGTMALNAQRAQTRHDELAEAAEGAKARAQDAVTGQLATVEGRAVSAASIPVLRAQLGVVDEATLRDGFSSEPWWEPVRHDFPIYGVAAGDNPEVLVGADASGLDFSPLVKSARKKRQASSILVAQDSAVVAGAALVDGRAKGAPFVLLLGKPLDADFLDEVASRTRGGALLSDGKRVLLSAGPAEEQEHLKQAVGKEKAGFLEGGSWAAGAGELAPGVWLWSHAKPRTAAAQTPVDVIALWALAVAGAIVSVVVGFRGNQKAAPPEAESVTITSDPARAVRSNPGRTDPTSKTTPTVTDPGKVKKAKPLERPKQFGRYYLIDRLGEGGMAEVYTALAFGAENFAAPTVLSALNARARHGVVRTKPLRTRPCVPQVSPTTPAGLGRIKGRRPSRGPIWITQTA